MGLSLAAAGVIGAGISAAGNLLGGRSARKDASRTRRQQQAQFDAMMDQTVQRRVKDAQAAGIHPLAALGVSPSSGPTITGVGVGAEGEAIARAGEAAGRGVSNYALAKAQLRNIESQTGLNEAQRQYWLSQAARRSGLSPGTDGGATAYPYGQMPADVISGWEPTRRAPAKTVPAERVGTGSNMGTEAGNIPGNAWTTFHDGHRMRVYSEGLNADEISQGVIAAGRAKWHAEWQMWKINGPNSARGQKARRWILKHSDPRMRAEIEKRLRDAAAGRNWLKVRKKER